MTLRGVIYWTIRCDVCGKDAFAGGEYSAWSDKDGALESLGDDWDTWGNQHRCPDHNPFCIRCGKDAGEYCGERDYMCPQCFENLEVNA
jgi:hypothetical protein